MAQNGGGFFCGTKGGAKHTFVWGEPSVAAGPCDAAWFGVTGHGLKDVQGPARAAVQAWLCYGEEATAAA